MATGGGRKRKLGAAEAEASSTEAEAPPVKMAKEEGGPESGAEQEGGGSPKAQGPRESERTKELLQRIQEVEEEKKQIEGGALVGFDDCFYN